MAQRKRKSKPVTKHTLFYPRRILRYALIAAGIGLGLFLILFAAVYWGLFGDLPPRAELAAIRHHQATEVLSADGEILGKYYTENRVIVPMDKISPWVAKALIATEDARFFEHRGIDLISIGRVIFRTLLFGDRSQGGGSTISQQLAKNLFPREKTRWYALPVVKIREMIIATRLEGAYSKEELLHLYLTTVPFGDNIFGIEVAARRYFNISAKQLKPHQAALLIGMLKANTLYHPVKYPERALERRNVVLLRLREKDELTKAEYNRLKGLPLDINYSRESHHLGLATYFREHLRIEVDSLLKDVRKADGTKYNLYNDGLRIRTTLNARMQQYAEAAMESHMMVLQTAFDKEWKGGKPWGSDALLDKAMRNSPRWKAAKAEGLSDTDIKKLFKEPIDMTIFTWQGEATRRWTPMDSLRYTISLLHAGVLAGDPQTGAILAWVGGINHRFFQYDHVKARRQVGSTFKPVVYAAALEAGFDPCDYFENQEVTYPDYDNWTPKNASNESGGVYTMAGALGQSLNTITASLIMETGVDRVIELARKFGFTGPIDKVPSISLGVADANLWEVLTLYGTLANEGIRPHWYYISRIEDADGRLLFEAAVRDNQQLFERAIAPEHALFLRHSLEMAVDSGTARALRPRYGLNGPLAGKTGTTQDHADGWFAGFSAQMVAAVRVGAEMPGVHFKSLMAGAGSRTAMPIFGKFWASCQKDTDLRHMVLKPFSPIPELLAADFNCPPYLPEFPEIADEGGGLLDFLGLGKETEPQSEALQRKPSEASEKIRERNEKLIKKRERKESWKSFWDGVFNRNE